MQTAVQSLHIHANLNRYIFIFDFSIVENPLVCVI